MKAEREEPRECKLDVVPPTLPEIDQRIDEKIAAQHQFMMNIMAEVVAQLQRDWAAGAIRSAGRAGSARQAAASEVLGTGDCILRGRRRRP